MLFDNSSRKSEIHSTMIDKCVQARRPRRSSLRQLEQVAGNKVEYAEIGTHLPHNVTVHQPRQEDGPTLMLYHQQQDKAIPTTLTLPPETKDEDSESSVVTPVSPSHDDNTDCDEG